MHNDRFAGCLLCLAFLVGLGSGCQAFHSDRTLAVLVRDAETKKPVASAEVYLCERVKRDEVAPCRSKGGFTQADGIAQLHAEPSGEFGLQVQAVAQGYLPDKVNVSADALKTSPTPASPPKGKARSPEVVVEMYAEPSFSVELVLPPNYRGLVKVEVQLLDNLPLAAGQRCFRFPVSASGEVQVRGPSLLRRVQVADFRARYANGPMLGMRMGAETIGFHWLKGAGNQHYFVAGTQMDYEKLHAQLAPEEASEGGSWEDASPKERKHKYRYGKMTGKNYEPDN
ncbi:MAG TPA: hypothetical protein VMG10_36740 [Gemmataceae bacterium]|nr:hypothetical protein [Gemmataceae bacterium]